MTRDEVFLKTINQIYEFFKLNQIVGNISAYSYKDNQMNKIKNTSGQGDTAYFIPENSGFIVVDYGLIINAIENKIIKISDKIKEMYEVFEEQIGFIAACDCFSIFAYRDNRNDFDKKITAFKLDISHAFFDKA